MGGIIVETSECLTERTDMSGTGVNQAEMTESVLDLTMVLSKVI